ncbi:UNVERIFIED_CONTAM: hypothetical protein HDU68_004140 [Siphonaria sp. JEL0065]|nr:hypothetical protein HDU68_004140 [Siphonaria sp. JEL0065]
MPYNKTTTQTTKTVTAADGTKTTTTHTKTVYELIAALAAARPGPHEDFYKYANHAWLNDPNVVIPAEYPLWGSFIGLIDSSLKTQVSLLQELATSEPASVDEAKIAAVWKASLDRFNDWAAGKGSLAPILESLATIESYLKQNTDEGLAAYFALSQKLGIAQPVKFFEVPHFDDSNHVVLGVSGNDLSLPNRDFYFEDNFKEKRDLFLAHLNNVAKLVGVETVQTDFAEAVFRFESKLAYINMKSHQEREYTKYYSSSSLSGFVSGINDLKFLEDKLTNYGPDATPAVVSEQEQTRIANFLETIYEELGLRAALQSNYSKNYPEGPAEKVEQLLVFDGDYFRRVFAILFDEANRGDLKAYLQYKAIKAAKEYTTKEVDEEFFDFYARKLRGQKEQKSDEKRSTALVNEWVGFLLGQVYVKRYFDQSDKDRVSGMIQEVVNVMEASITRNDWLTDATKEAAKVKLSQFSTKIGFPDVWKSYDKLAFETGDSLWDLNKRVLDFKFQTEFLVKINAPVDKTEWFIPPQVVNAFYNPQENEILFPAAIIQPPFYAKSVDAITFDVEPKDRAILNNEGLILDAANFGGIVAVIAHEITHGFDDQGRSFDGEGNVRDWWTEDDSNLFKTKCDCMEKQGWSFVEKETGKTHSLNCKLTMGENLADLGGISLALQALLKRAEGVAGLSVEAKLALMRIFFFSWANVWRTKATDSYLVNQLATDPHSPGNVRCNLVKNIDYFYEAFNVKEGDPMFVPKAERVAMW